MYKYTLSHEEFKKFIALLSHLKNQVNDVIVRKNSVKLMNDEQNAVLVINNLFENSEISFVINSVKRSLPLLKLLLSGNQIKIEVDTEKKISVWTDGEVELSWRYTTDSINKVTEDYEENLEKKVNFTVPTKFVEHLDIASKGLREDAFEIYVTSEDATFYIESKPMQKLVKLLSIKLDKGLEAEETLRFPVSPLTTFYSMAKDIAGVEEYVAMSLLKDNSTNSYYLSMESSSEELDGRILLRSVTPEDLERELDEELDEEYGSEEELEIDENAPSSIEDI